MAAGNVVDDEALADGSDRGASLRVLVTGASGFVGRALVPCLSRYGINGVATGRRAPGDLPAGWVGCTRTDLLAQAQRAGEIDAIVHLEVRQHVPRPSPADAADFERINVGNTHEWLEWAARAGVERFVFLSSIKAVSPALEARCETDSPNAHEPYGRSKAAAEDAVRNWAAASSERAAVILRASPVYGPGNEANLAAFARQVMRGKRCLIDDGSTQKSIISVRNLAAAVLFTMLHARPGCEVYNASDRETRSLAEIAGLIAQLSGAPSPRAIPAMPARWVAWVGDFFERITGRSFPLTTPRLRALCETTVFPCDKLVAAGFAHPQTTEEGLAEMVAWLKRTATSEP